LVKFLFRGRVTTGDFFGEGGEEASYEMGNMVIDKNWKWNENFLSLSSFLTLIVLMWRIG